jgi:hypothetical protein
MSTTALPAIVSAHAGVAPKAVAAPRRAITPQAGRAVELLAHAIEYLTDEYVHERGFLNPADARMEAVQLLMRLNREVYFECPVVPSLGERCRSLMQKLIPYAH